MKVSVNWLKELVDIDLSTEELAHTLTMAGLEVEEITPVAPAFDKIVVAQVKSVNPHPGADKLRVCEVDAGTGVALQIVCGAPNVTAGQKVPCALVGAKLPGIEIKQARLRGVDSSGMLCSARELGLSEDHSGLLVLPEDTPVGQDVRKVLDLDDVYFTLKLTPNRGDCLSMFGIARDLAAITATRLRLPTTEPVPATIDDQRSIKLSAPHACSRYCGRVIRNINARAKTPELMKRRLERAGFRSISPLVDITNYMTLERGRPMHAFDLDKLKGGMEVRWPKPGEEMNLLNLQHVVLKPDMLLIADDAGPVAMGGVMGGLESMVTDATTHVFFEAAYFDPAVIQGKTRELGINSDAAYRFERGVDFDSAREGLEYVTRLTLKICGGEAGPVTEAVGDLPTREAVLMRPARAVRLIGMPISTGEMEAIFVRLQCKVERRGVDLHVAAPSYRFDLVIEEDFVEEVARLHGYEHVPAAAPRSSVPMLPLHEGGMSRNAVKHRLVASGYQEVINYSFIPEAWEADFAGNANPVRLANPIASHMSVMRTSLFGGLMETLRSNLNRGEERARLFEVGRCFLSATADCAAQPEKVAGLAYGRRYPEQWGQDKMEKVDFFAVKGEVESLCAGLAARFEKAAHPAFHPGRCSSICMGDESIGVMGELHPKWQQKYELPSAPVLFELNMQSLVEGTAPRFADVSRMQSVRRDIAIVVDEAVSLQAIMDAVKPGLGAVVSDFSLFDLYHGGSIENGQKSLAFRVLMQDTDRTLTDSEADEIVGAIVKVLVSQFGATLRK
jgi:phenylalanyl-tRNA synthetase beta chain